MSIHVWRCKCGRRWYRMDRAWADTVSAITTWCPECEPFREYPPGWREL